MYKSNFETYKSKLYLHLSPQSRNVGSERWQIRSPISLKNVLIIGTVIEV